MSRYIVKAVLKSGEIRNVYSTNEYSSAMAVEYTARQIYVETWICDNIQEIMVG